MRIKNSIWKCHMLGPVEFSDLDQPYTDVDCGVAARTFGNVKFCKVCEFFVKKMWKYLTFGEFGAWGPVSRRWHLTCKLTVNLHVNFTSTCRSFTCQFTDPLHVNLTCKEKVSGCRLLYTSFSKVRIIFSYSCKDTNS